MPAMISMNESRGAENFMEVWKMESEKMAELKIKIPERWMNFIDDYFEVTGRDSDEEFKDCIRATIEMFIGDLDNKETVRLVEKHHLEDIYKISQRLRDEVAGIPHPAEPAHPWKGVVDLLVANPKFKESFYKHQESAIKKAFIEAFKELSSEEAAEIRAAAPAA